VGNIVIYYIQIMELSQKIGEATSLANRKTRMERAHSTELFKRATANANPNSVDKVLKAKEEELIHDNKNGISKIVDEAASRMGVDITI